MQRIVHIILAHTGMLIVRILVEMRLDGNNMVVVVNTDGLHPRMVGACHINRLEPGCDGKHQRRYQHVARTGHSKPCPEKRMAEPTAPFNGGQIVALHADVDV